MRRPTLVLLILAAAACSGEYEDETLVARDEAAVAAAPSIQPPQVRDRAASDAAVGRLANQTAPVAGSALTTATDTSSDRAPNMIIRTGTASVQVENVDEAAAKVRALASKLGGYVANSSFEGGEHNVRSATLELKLPAARYDEAVAGLALIGDVESVNSNSEDVGEEYVDLTARAANSRRLEQRLVQLLATRTGKLEDVLAVERELARVREEIERIEGRLRYLRTRVSLSTLVVTVHEQAPILGRAAEHPIVGAFKDAWRNFVRFVAGLIASLGVLVPLAAMGFAVFLLYHRYWRGRR